MNINPFDVLKNAHKLQEQMNGFQEKLETIKATGSSGGSMVEIDINGRLEVLDVRIAPQAVQAGDTEMLQDLIMAAFTDAMTKVRESISSEVGAMGFPGVK